MTGFQRQPFAVREKETERLPREFVEHYKVKPKEVTEKIKEEIKRLRDEKLKKENPVKFESEILKQSALVPKSEKIEKPKIKAPPKTKPKPARKINPAEEAARKVTLVGLGNASYKDLAFFKGDNFDPEMLITHDEDDPEYAEIMKKFEHHKNESLAVDSKPDLTPALKSPKLKNSYFLFLYNVFIVNL